LESFRYTFEPNPPVIRKGLLMNLSRIALAALGGFVAYFVLGGLAFGMFPLLRNEFLKYPAVYRTQESMKSVMPAGMAAMFVGILVLAVIYAMLYQGASSVAEGARFGALFGALIGIFAICAFVVHNYVNLNIGLKLTVEQAVAYFVEWVITCIVIGVIYRPIVPH
jgi:Protein of unknown function (DUF1761)